MSARVLFEIALRVLGLWFFFTSIVTLTAIVTVSFSGLGPTGYLWGPAATAAAQFIIGGLLVFFAPAMSAWFYPAIAESEAQRAAIGPGDIYRAACFVLGAYLLVSAARPAALLLDTVLSGERLGRAPAEAMILVVYAGSGLLLVFGSRPIAELLSNLRYDPDTIPKQQFSLALLLTVIVVVAIALGTFRMLYPGP